MSGGRRLSCAGRLPEPPRRRSSPRQSPPRRWPPAAGATPRSAGQVRQRQITKPSQTWRPAAAEYAQLTPATRTTAQPGRSRGRRLSTNPALSARPVRRVAVVLHVSAPRCSATAAAGHRGCSILPRLGAGGITATAGRRGLQCHCSGWAPGVAVSLQRPETRAAPPPYISGGPAYGETRPMVVSTRTGQRSGQPDLLFRLAGLDLDLQLDGDRPRLLSALAVRAPAPTARWSACGTVAVIPA